MRFVLQTANVVSDAKNCLYPNRVEVGSAEELQQAVKFDHVCAEYQKNYRSIANFIKSNAVVMDCDNDFSDNPADWVTPKKLDELLPDVSYAIAFSRNHMKEKGGKSARPKFHVYFETEEITDAGAYAALKVAIKKAHPFFVHIRIKETLFYGHDSCREEIQTATRFQAYIYGRSVNIDYHVVFEYNRYSCPYQYAKKKVDLRVTDSKVEIYSGSDRIATHNRFAAGRKNQYSTHAEDMPEKFKFTPWNEERIQKWASSIGKYTGEVVERIFEAVTIKEQGFNPTLAVLRLSNKYSEARLEAACEFAITSGIRKPRYHHLNSILASNQDLAYLENRKTKRIQALLWGICGEAAIMREVATMINDETKRKLRELNMSEIISGLEIQQSEPETLAWSFDDRIQRLVDYVYQEKYNSRIQRLIKSARLRFPQADMHGIYYDGRGLNKTLLNDLFHCQYVGYHQSIVLQGPTGSGKTYLACALAKQACLGQIKARYIRLPDLLMEYGDASIIQGKQKRLLASYSKIPLLVIDEWLVSDMSDSELYFLFELFERRSDTTSTIFCTQYRQEDWVTRLNESVQAEAIVDRYAHTSFWIEMGSMNMREYCAKHKI